MRNSLATTEQLPQLQWHGTQCDKGYHKTEHDAGEVKFTIRASQTSAAGASYQGWKGPSGLFQSC